jgi:LmbE family N-acetylglucosaminyl deacetylase
MHVSLSPHLDDAVLSCGGFIHHLTQQGQPVLILTLMAGDPPDPLPDTPIVNDLHSRWQAGYNPSATRRREDEAATAVLGASVQHLELGDCVYRMAGGRALYPSEESLFGEVQPDDPAIDFLRHTVLPGYQALYAPLGVGYHVDHQIVRDWARSLAGVKFYTEYPYHRDTIAIDRALAHFAPAQPRPQRIALNDADVSAKIRAIACYESQISTFWADHTAMANETRTIMQAADGVPVEYVYELED